VTPFSSDWVHRALVDGESAHLASFPEADADASDPELEAEMQAARTVVTLGRAAREEVQLRVRQPLRTLEVVLPKRQELRPEILELVKGELNVKQVEFLSSSDRLVRLAARPNFRTLGPRFKAEAEEAAQAIRELSEEKLGRLQERADGGLAGEGPEVTIEVGGEEHPVGLDDLEIVEEAAGDRVVRTEGEYTVALDPTLDDELRREGLARELVNRIQRLRKDAGLEITDRIRLVIRGETDVREAVEGHEDFISGETLASRLELLEVREGAEAEDGGGGPGPEDRAEVLGGDLEAVQDVDLDGIPATIALARQE